MCSSIARTASGLTRSPTTQLRQEGRATRSSVGRRISVCWASLCEHGVEMSQESCHLPSTHRVGLPPSSRIQARVSSIKYRVRGRAIMAFWVGQSGRV